LRMDRKSNPVGTYLFDWFITLVFLGVFLVLQYVADPVVRDFNRQDVSISYELKDETIGDGLLIVLSFVIPFVIILFSYIISIILFSRDVVKRKKLAIELNTALLGLFQSWIFCNTLVNFMKLIVGELRPDFLARCQPDPLDVCTGDPAVIKEGRKSFPSMHSSMAMSGLGYLAFFIAGKLRPYDGEGFIWKMVTTTAPFVLALWIGLTRISDNQHHPWDVFFGFLIGVGFAWGMYQLHFPSLFGKKAGVSLYIIRYKDDELV